MLCPLGKRKQVRSAVTKDTTLYSINEPVLERCADKGSYRFCAHTHRHTQTQDCASRLDSMVAMKNVHQVQFCCSRNWHRYHRYRLEGTGAARCDIVKQFEAHLNNRSQETAYVSVLSLLSSTSIHEMLDSSGLSPKVIERWFHTFLLPRVVGFHRGGSSLTHFRTPIVPIANPLSLFVSMHISIYFSYFHLRQW